MILADKIILERKKNGWSQEEFAEKLSVSRQSVSKWEGAQAVPDLQKILKMAEIFNVSTDYLLKDEIEPDETPVSISVVSDDVPPLKKVSMEEANEFIKFKATSLPKIGLGIALCITCPVILIFLAGLNEFNKNLISESLAIGIGMICLFAQIAIAVIIFIRQDHFGEKYDYISKEDIDTEYGVIGLARDLKEKFSQKYRTGLIIGTTLCILCSIPLIISAIADAPEVIIISMVCVLLLMIAVAFYIFTSVCGMNDVFDMLLQERDFSHKGKINSKKLSPITSLYWSLVTGIAIIYCFFTGKWPMIWLFFAGAGVLFPAFRKIVKLAMKIED